MSHPNEHDWDDRRDQKQPPPERLDHAGQDLWRLESRYLDHLAADADAPLPGRASFAAAVLDDWQQQPVAEDDPFRAITAADDRPLDISRWWGIAAALMLSVWIGYLAGRDAGEPAASSPPRETAVADATEGDPLGILMQDVGRQIEQRPEQLRRALLNATALINGPSQGDPENRPRNGERQS